MSTASLRRDHDLIDKVIKSMEITVQLLESGKKIPESILNPVIDFSKNFTDVCHHSKEEKSLFPAFLEYSGPINIRLIAADYFKGEFFVSKKDKNYEVSKCPS